MYLWLITVVYFQNWQTWASAENKSSVCYTPECIKLGNMFKNNLKEDGKPCVDFYSYVCHGWAKQNPRPKHISYWHAGQALEEEAFANLRKLVEDKKVSNIKEEESAKALYRACMNMPHMEKSDPETITLNLGEWPLLYPQNQEPKITVPAWVVDKRYIELTGQSALFDFKIEADESNFEDLTTALHNLHSTYGSLIRKKDWSNTREYTHYTAFLNKIIRKVAPRNSKLSDVVINNDIEQIIRFREELRQIIESTKSKDIYRLTINMFQEWYDHCGNPEKYNWLDIIRAIRKNSEDPRGLKITPESIVYAQQHYFDELIDLLKKTPKRVVVNHIHLYFVERHLKLDPSLIVELKDSLTVGVNASGLIRYDAERWNKCLKSNNMELTLGKMYVKSYFPKESQVAVKKLLEEGKQLLKQQIVESNWIDLPTVLNAFEKIKKMRDVIGYPDWESKIADIQTIIRNVNPMKLHVVYVNEWNLISITAAYLQSPVYTPNVPYVINYGSTVYVLGHELYHAFDSNGIMHAADGKRIIWSQPMLMKYSNQTVCFVHHYDKFQIDEFKKHGACMDDNCPFTFDEDLADSMGLKLAYKGYKQKLKESKGACQVLPRFEDFSCEKLFFIAFANTFCAAPTIGSQETNLFRDEHSPFRIRVNAAVSNMREFGDAFNCKTGDPLMAKNTCDIWKK